MSKNVKMTNPMKVITGPNTRWSYANVWEPKSINGGTPKYSVSLIIPKSDTKTVVVLPKPTFRGGYSPGGIKTYELLRAQRAPIYQYFHAPPCGDAFRKAL